MSNVEDVVTANEEAIALVAALHHEEQQTAADIVRGSADVALLARVLGQTMSTVLHRAMTHPALRPAETMTEDEAVEAWLEEWGLNLLRYEPT